MTDVVITLTTQQAAIVVQVGILKAMMNIDRGNSRGLKGDGLVYDINGSGAEYAVAVHLGLDWTPITVGPDGRGVPDTGDVGIFRVRSTVHAHGHLLLHRPDPESAPYIHTTGRLPTYVLRGWCWGHEGKRKEFWGETFGNGREPCFSVPHGGVLRPMFTAEQAAVIEAFAG